MTAPTPSAHGINYVVEGSGSPVILIHGVAASRYDWALLMPELVRSGFQVFAPDLPGHGDSDKPDDPAFYQIEAIYNRLEAWIDSLGLSEPAMLVGHSLGGYLSIMHAARCPKRVRGLVLVDPLYSSEQLTPLLRAVRRRPAIGSRVIQIVPEWLINALLGWDPGSAANFSAEIRQQIANDYKRASPHFVYITHDFPDLTPSIAGVRAPTMVIWGEHDMTLRPESFYELVEMLPMASSHPIPHSGHQPHIGKPELVNHLILEFAGSHLPGLDTADPG